MAIQNENKLNDVPINGDKLKGEIMADLGGAKVITLLGEKIEGFDFKEMYEAFAKLFGITEGDGMYIDPSKRITIW